MKSCFSLILGVLSLVGGSSTPAKEEIFVILTCEEAEAIATVCPDDLDILRKKQREMADCLVSINRSCHKQLNNEGSDHKKTLEAYWATWIGLLRAANCIKDSDFTAKLLELWDDAFLRNDQEAMRVQVVALGEERSKPFFFKKAMG